MEVIQVQGPHHAAAQATARRQVHLGPESGGRVVAHPLVASLGKRGGGGGVHCLHPPAGQLGADFVPAAKERGKRGREGERKETGSQAPGHRLRGVAGGAQGHPHRRACTCQQLPLSLRRRFPFPPTPTSHSRTANNPLTHATPAPCTPHAPCQEPSGASVGSLRAGTRRWCADACRGGGGQGEGPAIGGQANH